MMEKTQTERATRLSCEEDSDCLGLGGAGWYFLMQVRSRVVGS